MPAIIGTLLLTAAATAGLEGVAAGGTALTIGSITVGAGTIGSVALGVASIGLQFALAPGAAKQPKIADGLISIRQPNPVRQGGYGRCRLGGSYMLYEATFQVGPLQWYSGDVVALVGGRICGFKQFYLGDDAVTLGALAPGDGLVVGLPDGRYAISHGAAIKIESRIGLATETAYSDMVSLFSGIWTSNHRGDGIASMMLECREADTAEHQSAIFPSGLPSPSAVCDLYPIWDPRDVTQDPGDASTWIPATVWSSVTTYAAGARVQYGGAPYYSYAAGNLNFTPDQRPDKWCSVLSNPVLQLIDYLTDNDHGMGLDRAVIITPVLTSLMAKATLCDELVIDKTGTLGPRYTSNGKFSFDDDPADVIGGILATCDGWMTEDGEGALALEIGVYSAATLILGVEDIVGFSINYGIADEQAVNELTLTFTSPEEGYKEVGGDPWRNNDDISIRGRTRSQGLALSWVQRHSQARRLAKRAMARLSAAHGTVTTTLYGLQALGQRWVRIQYPFLPQMDDVVVELARGTINPVAGTVSFDWVAVDPDTIDAWNAGAEEGTGPEDTAPAYSIIMDDAGQAIMDDAGNFILDDAF